MISLVIDAVIVALLGAALGYGWIISRRVTRLMSLLTELEPMVRAFSEAVDKSEESVKDLKAAAEVANQRIEPRLTAAHPDSDATFATRRRAAAAAAAAAPTPAAPEPAAPAAPVGLMQLGASKADLVRSFFETSRSRAV
ncbi:hypothetical protein V8J36_04850 [Frigidibacter sp. MR17.14]|uniref:hypothetical protein n=1 Tax=Frigidibacter sp. MR17.14 TaxID=3126509 RepID=UPI003012BDB3